MSAGWAQPTQAEGNALVAAVAANFPPCTCSPRGVCAGHDFLFDDPTRRGLAKQWQRLLWMRTRAAALRAEEGVPTAAPARVESAPDPNQLPW